MEAMHSHSEIGAMIRSAYLRFLNTTPGIFPIANANSLLLGASEG